VNVPCPLCEVRDAHMTPLEAFVLGIALAQESIGKVQAMCCAEHASIFAEASVRMLAKLQRLRRARGEVR
jgi:hypothetical protein